MLQVSEKETCIKNFKLVVSIMIRIIKNSDLAQCGMIYAKAFPMEHWGIDWTTDNATEYLRDFFEQKRFVGYVYEENDEVLGIVNK